MSQAELAARVGVTQSVISAYESGTGSLPCLPWRGWSRPPGMSWYWGCGGSRGGGRLKGPVGVRVRACRRELVDAAAAHGVSNLAVFGSVARGEDRPDSDVDLLADAPAGNGPVRAGPGPGRPGSHRGHAGSLGAS